MSSDETLDQRIGGDDPCPACGGAGGGPFGRPGSRWDDETYVCPRCQGTGLRLLPRPGDDESATSARPGIAKTTPPRSDDEKSARRSAG